MANGWCPYCCIPSKLLCDQEGCQQCLSRTWASRPDSRVVKAWRHLEPPHRVFLNTNKKIKLICDKCSHLFSMTGANLMSNKWCSCIRNKTEAKLREWLRSHSLSFKHQAKFDWCKKKKHLPFDFASERIILELDGAQHFVQVSSWASPEKTNLVDNFKIQKATENGYSVIRVLQEDVWKDQNNWESQLLALIEECTLSPVPLLRFVNYTLE